MKRVDETFSNSNRKIKNYQVNFIYTVKSTLRCVIVKIEFFMRDFVKIGIGKLEFKTQTPNKNKVYM